MNRAPYKLGVDIGGTFTDLVLIHEGTGAVYIDKVLTTPVDPSRAVFDGVQRLLKKADLQAKQIGRIIHGTTLVTNALIERKGVKTALITTRGFRDVLEIGREQRYDIYDLFARMPSPLVPRYLRRGVSERTGADGSVIEELDQEETQAVIRDLDREKVEAIAVSLLHSFRNPSHERIIEELIRRINPRIVVSLSSEVVPEIKEYERTSTTVANSYVRPLMQQYLVQLEKQLREIGFGGTLFMMLSDGGITTARTAAQFPIRVIESGPAGGAIAAGRYGELVNQRNLIAFDMGGTTAKICMIKEGLPVKAKQFEAARVYRFKKGSGIPLKVPVIELIEIGAGGGSIAKVNHLGLLTVGPESAGAEPGPACYDRGGLEPTVTDADLVLGYLHPEYFLGGEMKLDLEKARQAIAEKVARPLELSLPEAAWGINETVNENMVDSARVYAMEKGIEPTKFTMVVLGGAGPAHAYGIALKLKMKNILYPMRAGVLSALGFLVAPASFELSRSYVTVLGKVDFALVNRMYQELERDGLALIEQAGVRKDEMTFSRFVGARYRGQGYEVEVPVPNGEITSKALEAIQEGFKKEYLRIYNRLNEDIETELIDWRVVVSGPIPHLGVEGKAPADSQQDAALKGHREVYFPDSKGYVTTAVYDRYQLRPGDTFDGPAVLEERESTVVVGPKGHGVIDAWGNIRVTLEE
jgi:N-methylhydantoinase A